LGGGLITWQCRRQSIIALSSTKAEYIACASAAKKAMWIKQLMKEIGFNQMGPIPLHCDNQSCIALTKNPHHHDRSKHIDIRHHYLRERVEHGHIEGIFCPTEDMIADILTKALSKHKHFRCLGLMDIK
jgi:hypothetical protein